MSIHLQAHPALSPVAQANEAPYVVEAEARQKAGRLLWAPVARRPHHPSCCCIEASCAAAANRLICRQRLEGVLAPLAAWPEPCWQACSRAAWAEQGSDGGM